MREYHFLNLGAGVQSTTLDELSRRGMIQRFDAEIFADVQEEPPEVYRHLRYLLSVRPHAAKRCGDIACWCARTYLPDHPWQILINSVGCLGDDLSVGENSTGQRFASIPAFTAHDDGCTDVGLLRRQCTKEYKIEVIEKTIRRNCLGLAPGQRVPKDVVVHQYIGISWDERSRAFDVRRRFLNDDGSEKDNWKVHFPLLDINGPNNPGWTREDCKRWLSDKVPHETPRSACAFCPYHSDLEWARLKREGGSAWDRVVQIDTALRTPGTIVNRGLNQKLYLHSSCRPITEIDFENENQGKLDLGFTMECTGGCGL